MSDCDQRSLISKVTIEENGHARVVYSFSPTRFKFWLSLLVLIGTILGMGYAMREGAYAAVEEFVRTKCGEYLTVFHREVRPKLDADRHEDIDKAIAAHEAVTSAEYASEIHEVQMDQAISINEIKVEQAAQGATLDQMQLNEVHQTRLLEELVRRIE